MILQIWPKKDVSLTITLIVINVGILIAVFSFPPMSLPEDNRYSDFNKKLFNSDTNDFFLAELNKGIDEIQMRLKDQSDWFQYKFLFVGGLLAVFFGFFPFAYLKTRFANEQRQYDSGMIIEHALKSQTVPVFLSAICCLSLMIDIHIRHNAIVINQIGLWIAFHIEPLYLGANSFGVNDFVPWEIFLRRGGAMHTDFVNSITFFWPIHILTIVCYLLYLISAKSVIVEKEKIGFKVHILCFWIVHSCLIVIAWSGHYIPPIFQVKSTIIGDQNGIFAALPYAVLAALLTAINWMLIIRPKKYNQNI